MSQTITIAAPRAASLYRALAARYGTPLFVVDCVVAQRQLRQLQQALPNVALYYAIKALPCGELVDALAQAGAGFDIASSGEIDLLRRYQVDPTKTIHTHPVKRDGDIRDALNYGCATFAVDNVDEMAKLQRYRHQATAILRLAIRSRDAVVDLSKKFGCDPHEAPLLLDQARRLGVRVGGLSFHVGSQCASPTAHLEAIETALDIVRRERAAGFQELAVLDIGGGFPVDYHTGANYDIEHFCAPLRRALVKAEALGLRLWAEPGRFIAAPAATAIAAVAGRSVRAGRHWYYLDDGVYGCYSGQIYDGVRYPLTLVSATANAEHLRRSPAGSVLAGPTCDSVDVIAEAVALPPLHLNDLVVGRMMGAYTRASASTFNSLPLPQLLVRHAPSRQGEERIWAGLSGLARTA